MTDFSHGENSGRALALESPACPTPGPAPAPTTQFSALWLVAALVFVLLNAAKLTLFRQLLTDHSLSRVSLVSHTAEATACMLAVYGLILFAGRRSLLLVFYAGQLLYLWANLQYYQFFGYYLYLDELHRLLPSVFSILKVGAYHFDAWSIAFMADLPLLLFLVARKWPRRQQVQAARRSRVGAVAAALALCVFWLWASLASSVSVSELDTKEAEQRCVRKYGLLAFTVHDYFAGDRAYRHSLLHVSHRLLRFPPGRPLRNIYLVQVESMDARVVGLKCQGQAVMPFLSELRHESIYYPFTLSYHSGGGTSDCDFTVLNSVEPLRTASVFFDEHYDYPNAMPKVLRGSGYGVYAFHGNVIKQWGRELAYPKMGYSDFFDIAKMALAEQGWGAPDAPVFNFATQFTAACKAPFFAHLITMSSHYPYNSVEYYYHSAFENFPEDTLAARYFNSMNYVDGCLRTLVTELRRRDDGYIIILGDHTPPRIQSTALRDSKLSVGGAVLEFVPLFILGPGLAPREETRFVASFLDVAPTILSLSGVPCTYATSGIDLSAPPASPPPIHADRKAYSRQELFELCRSHLP